MIVSALMTFSGCLFPTESNSSTSDSESFSTRWRFFFGCFFMHFTAKWLLFLHALQTFPHAGHSSFFNMCICPKNLHIAFDMYGFQSRAETLHASAVVSSASFREFSCWEVASAAQHMLTQVFRLRSPSCSNHFLVELSFIPKTMWSLSRESFRQSQKLHVEARVWGTAM